MTNFYQCKMRRDREVTIGWIEERGAKVGLQIELLDLNDSPRFWTVAEVWQPPLDETLLKVKQCRDRNAFPSLVGQSR